MKTIRFLIKLIFIILSVFTLAVFSMLFYLKANVSSEYKIKRGDALNLDTVLPVTAEFKGVSLSSKSSNFNVGSKYDIDLKVLGVVPFSTVSVEVVDEMYVAVLGCPFGMKIYTKGVLVTDLTEVQTENGNVNPAKKAGLKIGDYIISVDGKKITTNEDLSMLIEASGGKNMDFLVLRKNTKIHINICGVRSRETNTYKLGIWIKDSSAGIGTLTFYSPATDIICGLGHGICDDDTNTLLEINSGEIVDANIVSIEKGTKGSPGQLNGRFGAKTLGNIKYNSNTGVYSKTSGNTDYTNYTEIALKQEVKNGYAKILCTVDDDEPKYYSCKIEIRSSAYHNKTQNMIITVTDKELLNKTGGIVQGMSGSPIIQNGKLVGAITHVLVDDSTKGYAIFAENMLETARSVTQLKEAG